MDASVTLLATVFSVWYLLVPALLVIAVLSAYIFLQHRKRRSEGRVTLVKQNVLVSALLDVDEAAVLIDGQGVVEFINPSAENLFRLQMRHARGKFHSELFHLSKLI